MNNRMRFNPDEAAAAGKADADSLLQALAMVKGDDGSGDILSDSLAEIIGLAVDNRLEECHARMSAFCNVIGPKIKNGQRLECVQELAGLMSSLDETDAAAGALGISITGDRQTPSILIESLKELRAAHQIIRNALAIMTTEQKVEWGRLNECDGVAGEGITRANEREAVFRLVDQVTESEGGEA